MWQITVAIFSVFYMANRTGLLDNIGRPKYVRRKSILRYAVEYPTLSFLTLAVSGMIPAVVMGHVEKAPRTDSGTILPGYMTTFSILCWMNVCEELFFRGVMIRVIGQNIGSYLVSSLVYSAYWSFLAGNVLPTAPIFGLLGLTYSFATEKYSVLELMLYKIGLFSLVLIA